jgi:putative FmdB family regulatory protein
MPTYDYVCDKCGHEFEYFQSMSDELLTECPECKAKGQVRRLIGCGAGIIFKGSGFYETDYKRKPSPGSSNESSSDSTSSNESSDTKSGDTKTSSDAKPAKADKPKKSKKEAA